MPAEWVSEPEWDDAEQDIMRAFWAIEKERCPRGHPLELLTDKSPAEEFGEDVDAPGIRVMDVWCRACRAMDIHEKAHQSADEKLAGTDFDEAPGRYSIARQIDAN